MKFVILSVEDEPFIRKNFLNDDEVVYKVKGMDLFVREIDVVERDTYPDWV